VKKGKNFPVCAMKAYRENGGTAPLILNLSTRWRWVVSLTPWKIYPQGKSPQYPLNGMLMAPHSLCGSFGDEKNLLSLPGFELWIVKSIA
jgi:hypothetical protein